MDTQQVLPHGTLEDIRSQVADRVKKFAPGGGFVFNPVHNIQPEVSPERILACFDAARKYGAYPVAT